MAKPFLVRAAVHCKECGVALDLTRDRVQAIKAYGGIEWRCNCCFALDYLEMVVRKSGIFESGNDPGERMIYGAE